MSYTEKMCFVNWRFRSFARILIICKHLSLYFLRNNEVVILVKIFLNAIFSCVQLKQSFLHERLHCEYVYEYK